ncbi:nitrogen assimilation transcription factor nit-4 [Fusarium coicis]|nr:nitrogen assimilation transcription factor nit-4 [Fusarium coicis]
MFGIHQSSSGMCVHGQAYGDTRFGHQEKARRASKAVGGRGSSESDLQQLFEAIRDRDEKDAMTIMRCIRAGEDPSTILRHLRAGDLLLQLHLAPETKFGNSFPPTFRMSRRLQVPDNVYFHSLVYEATFMASSPCTSSTIELHDRFRPQYLKPYSAAEFTDPRFSLIKPLEGTNVLNDDEMMRNMIRSYFRQQHQSLPFFHKDYFLEDMLSLVSVLRFTFVIDEPPHAKFSQSFCPDTASRLEYWNPESLRYRFLAESRRLWELEMEKEPRITTLQAAMVLNPIQRKAHNDFADLFKARCEMVQIANQVSIGMCQPKNDGESPSEGLLGRLDRYQEWFSKLPPSLQPTRIVYSVELQLHLQYHTFVMNLCEFLISRDGNTLAPEANKKVHRALSRSRDSFLSIMLLFYLNHCYDISLVSQEDIEENRGTLYLAAKGLSVQGGYYYLTYLVSLALQKEMSPDDLAVLQQSTVGRKEDSSTEHIRARHERQYPIHIVTIKDRRLGSLIKEYSAMRIQN